MRQICPLDPQNISKGCSTKLACNYSHDSLQTLDIVHPNLQPYRVSLNLNTLFWAECVIFCTF